jgi:hypothetical protein
VKHGVAVTGTFEHNGDAVIEPGDANRIALLLSEHSKDIEFYLSTS